MEPKCVEEHKDNEGDLLFPNATGNPILKII